MNCPQCGERNPSSATTCLHCNAQLKEEREELFDTSSEGGRNRLILVFGAVAVLTVGGAFYLFGYDTYESKCVRSESEAQELAAAPDWERDEFAERREFDRMDRQRGKQLRRDEQRRRYGFLQCYRKKTGHVDGAVKAP